MKIKGERRKWEWASIYVRDIERMKVKRERERDTGEPTPVKI